MFLFWCLTGPRLTLRNGKEKATELPNKEVEAKPNIFWKLKLWTQILSNLIKIKSFGFGFKESMRLSGNSANGWEKVWKKIETREWFHVLLLWGVEGKKRRNYCVTYYRVLISSVLIEIVTVTVTVTSTLGAKVTAIVSIC